MPKYAKSFKCTADGCRHSCCIGWQICIDEATQEKYRREKDKLGEEILSSIEDGENGVCFKLIDGRCQNLDEQGLCRIIKGLGEGFLCDICRLHPRYFSTFGSVMYGGIGLSCEEAARLILSEDSEHAYCAEVARGDADNDYDEVIFALINASMSRFIDIFTGSDKKFCEKLRECYALAKRLQGEIDGEEYEAPEVCATSLYDYFFKLEHLNPELMDALKLVTHENIPCSELSDRYLSRLAIYFLDRYARDAAYDGNLIGRIVLLLLSVITIGAMLGDGEWELHSVIEAARRFSAEVEYSEENVEKIISDVKAEGIVRRILSSGDKRLNFVQFKTR